VLWSRAVLLLIATCVVILPITTTATNWVTTTVGLHHNFY
jgi:hypothetical protein